MSKTWSTGLSVIRSCPYMNASSKQLYIRAHVLQLLHLLDKEFSDVEFLVYARRRETSIGVIIEDPVIPPQEVTSASVNVKEPDPSRDVVIHKHPSGLHDFSVTDDEYINANNSISLLYADGHIVKASVRVSLPCGHLAVVDIPKDNISVLVMGSLDEEYEIARRVYEEQKGNIKRVRYEVGASSYKVSLYELYEEYYGRRDTSDYNGHELDYEHGNELDEEL